VQPGCGHHTFATGLVRHQAVRRFPRSIGHPGRVIQSLLVIGEQILSDLLGEPRQGLRHLPSQRQHNE
jgi:hypothetical protein